MKEITLKGKKYKLKYGANAYASFEKETGLTTSEAMLLAQKRGLSFNVIRGLIWAGLLHINEDLRVEAVGNMMDCDVNSLIDYMEIAGNAIGDSMGGAEAIEKGIKRAKDELGEDVLLKELDKAGAEPSDEITKGKKGE